MSTDTDALIEQGQEYLTITDPTQASKLPELVRWVNAVVEALIALTAERDCLGDKVGDLENDYHKAFDDGQLGMKAELDALTAERDKAFESAEAYLTTLDKVVAERDALQEKLSMIERQAEDATEYVLAQINRELKTENIALQKKEATFKEVFAQTINKRDVKIDALQKEKDELYELLDCAHRNGDKLRAEIATLKTAVEAIH